MADRYYVGSDGIFNGASNWSATRNGSSGASVPTTGDNVWIENIKHRMTTSSAVTGLGTVIISGQEGELGSPTAAFQISGATLRLSTIANAYLDGAWSSACNILTSGAAKVGLGGTNTIASLSCGEVGSVDVASSVTVTNAVSAGMKGDFAGTAGAAPTMTSARWVGVLNTARTITTNDLESGAILTLTGAAGGTTLTAHTGSQVIDKSSGALTTVNVLPRAIYDNAQNAYPKTITTLNRWKGSEVIREGGGGSMTITTDQTVPLT